MKKSPVLIAILIFVIICIVVGLLNWWQKVTYEKRLIATIQSIIRNTESSSEIIEGISATWSKAISDGQDFSTMINSFLLKNKGSLEILEKDGNTVERGMLYLKKNSAKNREAYSAVVDLYINYNQIYSLAQSPRGTLISFNEEVNKLSSEYLKLLTKVKLAIPKLGELVAKATAERIALREKKVKQAQEEAENERKVREEAKIKAQEEAEKDRKVREEAERRREEMLRNKLAQAKELYESGKEKEASEIYISTTLSSDASLPKNLYLYLGKEYSSSNNYKEGIVVYSKAIDMNKKELSAYYGIADMYEKLERYENAIEFLRKTLEIDPKLDIIDRIAILYSKMKKYDDAIIIYRQGIRESPAEYYRKIASVYISQKKYDNVISTYKEAIQLLPNNITFFEKLGLLYISLNRYEDAIVIFKKALEITDFTGSKPFRNYIGNCYYFLKQYDQAEREYREALYPTKDNSEYTFNLGRVIVDKGFCEEGRGCLKIAEGLGKRDAELYYYLGKANKECKYFDKAKESFKEAMKLCKDQEFKIEIQKALEEINKVVE